MVRLNLTPKLVASFLVIGLLPFIIIGWVSLSRTSDALRTDAFNQLESVRAIKASQITQYFKERQGDARVLADTVTALGITDAASVTPAADGLMKSFVKSYGYYDLFLIDPAGMVFYSDAKEADFQTNMVNGKYAGSNLGELVRRVLKTGQGGLADFAPYAPSNNEPASFIAEPIIADGQVRLIVALQLSLKSINEVMQEREGLGRTGETYLVGPDLLMRSDSYLDQINHTVKASFADPAKGKVDTVASRAALAGTKASEIIIDYNGNPVLSAYTPVSVGGLSWALIAEIDEAEAFATIAAIRTLMLVIGAIGIVAIAFAGTLIARSIARPVVAMTEVMGQLSHDNLNVDVPHGDRHDEIGRMAQSVGHFKNQLVRVRQLEREQADQKARTEAERKAIMRQMADSFEQSVGKVVNTVTSAATELQAASTQMANIATETSTQATTVAASAQQASANVQTVASATEELATSINEIAHHVERSQDVSRRAGDQAGHTSRLVEELSESVGRIGEVVSLITAIASQTNLLALNATIEAARAGEAGKGFAVVANEVKGLANQTAKATDEIASQINTVQASTQNAVRAIEEISKVITEMSEISSSVASAVQEQTAATDEIARNVEQAAVGTEQVSGNIATVQLGANETGAAAQQIQTSSGDLSQQAEYLREEVASFLAQVRAG